MREARRLAASAELLRYEIDGHIRALLAGGGNRVGMNVLFLPTGPLQELSLDEGWGDEFCALAERFDVAVRAYGYYCSVCSKLAGTLVVEGNELRRESFTSTLTQPVTADVRAALGDAAGLYALDPELAPFYCPRCGASYCGEHWRTYDVFEDCLHDSIRGACPLGHDRMLED